MIELIDVIKKFNHITIVNNISITIRKGETLVIIGRSGTGKTVSLRLIAGLIQPDSGKILIDGTQVNDAPQAVLAKLREKMGVLFQSGALINWMTVGDNVALPLIEHQVCPPDQIQEIVDDRLRIMHLSDAKDKMPSDISGGMKKRAGLARALVRNPEIILYDEPTSGLDPVMSRNINRIIVQMQQDLGVTSVVVTHDMHSAYDIADRIAMLYMGEIIQCGTPDEIRNTDNPIVQQFIRGESEGPMDVDA